MEAATKALLYLCPGFLLAKFQKLSRASTANFTLLSSSNSPSSMDNPLDKNPGMVAYNWRKFYKDSIKLQLVCMKLTCEQPMIRNFLLKHYDLTFKFRFKMSALVTEINESRTSHANSLYVNWKQRRYYSSLFQIHWGSYSLMNLRWRPNHKIPNTQEFQIHLIATYCSALPFYWYKHVHRHYFRCVEKHSSTVQY